MIEEKHEKWIKSKFPIFYTIKINLQEEFTPSELESLQSQLVINRCQVSKHNQKTLKKLKKLANDTQKEFKSNKELYKLLSTVQPEQIHEIILAHKKLQCLRPLQKQRFIKLTDVDLSYNQITNIAPLVSCKLPSFAYFNLCQNQVNSLKGLQMCAWTKLKVLNLSRNCIDSIEPLANGEFPSLEKLDLSENHITSISSFHKSSSKELKILNFRKNNINEVKNIERFRFTKISELNLKDNPLINTQKIEKFQPTTIRFKRSVSNEKNTPEQQKLSKQQQLQFIKYSYKLSYSKVLHKMSKQDLFLLMFAQMKGNNIKKAETSSKHYEFSTIDQYKQPDNKYMIMPSKKIHFD